MTISTIYKVSITVPNEVLHRFAWSDEYVSMMVDAEKGYIDYGYGTVGNGNSAKQQEWATFDTIDAAEAAEVKMKQVIDYFHEILNNE